MSESLLATSEIFDRQSVLDMVDGELDFVHELIELFLTNLPEQISKLRTGAVTSDSSTVQKVAHRLKSSIGNLGGRRAQEAITQLEDVALDGDLSRVDELLAQFERELSAFEQALRGFLAEA